MTRRRGVARRSPIARHRRLPVKLVLALALVAAAPADPTSHLVRLPDGRHLNFSCTGAGAPTVILESGFAANAQAWPRVKALVAPSHRVCSYDRAGGGLSDPGPLPRDGAAIARDLDDGLRAARIGGPLVVVGHSAGGLYVRLFADRRRRDVVGMVLVDPSVEYQDRRLATAFGPGAGSIGGIHARVARCLAAAEAKRLPSPDPALAKCGGEARASFWATQLSEIDTLWTATSDELAAGRRSYGALPLVVLTAGDSYAASPNRGAIEAVWAGLHDEVAARSTRGVRRSIAGSGHLMMRDRPDAVAAAIAEIVAASEHRERRAPLGTPRPIG